MFIVSVRKDLDDGNFEFPEGFDNGVRLKDLLESEVEERYYIENDRSKILIEKLNEQELLKGNIFAADSSINEPKQREISNCITSRYDAGIQNQKQIGLVIAEPEIVASRGRNPENPSDRTTGSPTEQRLEPNTQGMTNTLTTVQKDNLVLEPKRLGGLYDGEGKRRQAGAVWEKENIAPTLDTCQGGHREPLIVVKEGTKKGYDIAKVGDSINLSFPGSITRRGKVGKGVSQTLDTSCNIGTLETDYRIRKLTPLECFRLMGFDDEDYYKARTSLEQVFYKGNDKSNSQMYKQAGNSIVVNVLEEIFKSLKRS